MFLAIQCGRVPFNEIDIEIHDYLHFHDSTWMT